jgi:hypothetical protein
MHSAPILHGADVVRNTQYQVVAFDKLDCIVERLPHLRSILVAHRAGRKQGKGVARIGHEECAARRNAD